MESKSREVQALLIKRKIVHHLCYIQKKQRKLLKKKIKLSEGRNKCLNMLLFKNITLKDLLLNILGGISIKFKQLLDFYGERKELRYVEETPFQKKQFQEGNYTEEKNNHKAYSENKSK